MFAYLKWFEKLSRPVGNSLSNSEYFRSYEILKAEFSPWIVGGVWTLEQAVHSVDMRKSPGQPYVQRGCSTKQEAWDKFAPEIIENTLKLIRGEFVECIFIGTLKDELLKEGKFARVFCPAPFHHQLACAILFGPFSDQLVATVHKHSSALGMNTFGRGLNKGLMRLSKHPYGYDADFTGWDTGLRDCEPERDFIKTCIPSDFHAGVDLLFNLALCPQVEIDGNVFQLSFQPSGWFLTAVLNTLKNYRQVCESFIDCYSLEFGSCSVSDMRRHLLQLNGGDDLAFSTDYRPFDIAWFSKWCVGRGLYIETDCVAPRHPFELTFYSHNLYSRHVEFMKKPLMVAGGRVDKMLSAFSYYKVRDGRVDYLATAARVTALLKNIWAFEEVYDLVHEYCYHLVHHCFYHSGQIASGEWNGVFKSMPDDFMMVNLWFGSKPESLVFF